MIHTYRITYTDPDGDVAVRIEIAHTAEDALVQFRHLDGERYAHCDIVKISPEAALDPCSHPRIDLARSDLSFAGALHWLRLNQSVTRAAWPAGVWVYLSGETLMHRDTRGHCEWGDVTCEIDARDLLAHDWRVGA